MDKQKAKPTYTEKPADKYYTFALYVFVVILINITAAQLFFRVDLTANKLYSLSDASKRVVSTLNEPLTVNVFFSKNLPAQVSNVEAYLNDLLQEYEANSNGNFSYRFYDVSAKEGDLSEEAEENRKIAQSYGIYPVSVRVLEQDQAKVIQAYMGIALIHGDVVEKLPSIKTTEGLEYKLTNSIQKMNNKISALSNLPEKIKVTLVSSSSLRAIAPMVKLQGLENLKNDVQSAVEKLQPKVYGQFQFISIDPTVGEGTPEQMKPFERIGLRWPEVKGPNGMIPAGEGKVALSMSFQGKSIEVNLLRQTMALTERGMEQQYVLLKKEEIETFIRDNIDNLIDINEDIGYLTSHGAPPLFDNMPPQMRMFQRQAPQALSKFNGLLSREYTVKDVKLDDGIPESIDTLVIAGVKQNFNDWELYQIDQFLMKGKSLAIFVDAFNEIQPQQQRGRFQQPFYLPLNTGLEKLLGHYGVNISKSYVLDENCYVQRGREGNDMPIYFIPIIMNEKIDHSLDFLENVKQLAAIKVSPLEANEDKLKQNNLELTTLFSSSDKSWEMKGQINLMPFMIKKPEDKSTLKSFPLAYLVEGEFPSYFAGKQAPPKPEKKEKKESPIPGMPAPPEEKKDDKEEKKPVIKSAVTKREMAISKGKPGKIFLIASSEMLKDNVLDEEGISPNSVFLLNTIDYLNSQEDIAVMRGKNQRFNPLKADIDAGTKTAVKWFNIAGLPIIVIFMGVLVYIRRSTRKRMIQAMFAQRKELNK